MKTTAILAFIFVQTLIFYGLPIYAQLKGDHLLGAVGLQSGTQGPPGLDFLMIPAYLYTANKLKGNNGDVITSDLSLSSFALAPGLSWTLKTKLFNANIGGSVLLPFAANKIESNIVNSKTSLAISDSYIQPLILGWHGKRADFLASFNLYLPTGKYEQGGDDNSGLGMWAYEFSGGTTLYLDQKKTWHFATLLSYELNSKKKGTDTRAGDLLSVEGGLGKTWYKKAKGPVPIVINAGLAYYMQFKTTSDEIPVGNTIASGDKDHIYGIGAEANIFLPSVKSLFLLRWLTETGAVNRLQGNTYLMTWVYSIKSF